MVFLIWSVLGLGWNVSPEHVNIAVMLCVVRISGLSRQMTLPMNR
jgi:hypothetical protein